RSRTGRSNHPSNSASRKLTRLRTTEHLSMTEISFAHTPWPDCTVQIMSYDDEVPDFPGTHGIGFFVQLGGRVFLLTARHCVGKLGEDLASRAHNLMIPITTPVGGRMFSPEDYVRFGS